MKISAFALTMEAASFFKFFSSLTLLKERTKI
jgi:hypothetical protein